MNQVLCLNLTRGRQASIQPFKDPSGTRMLVRPGERRSNKTHVLEVCLRDKLLEVPHSRSYIHRGSAFFLVRSKDTVEVTKKKPWSLRVALVVSELEKGLPEGSANLPVRRSINGSEETLGASVPCEVAREGDVLARLADQICINAPRIPTDPEATAMTITWDSDIRRKRFG